MEQFNSLSVVDKARTTAESFLEKAIYSLCKTREELANDFHCDLDRFPEVGFPFYMHDFNSEAPNQKPSVQFVPEFANGVYGENESEDNNIVKRLQKSFEEWQPQKGLQTCPVGVLTGASATGKTRAAYEFGTEMGIPIIIKIYENGFKKTWEAFYSHIEGTIVTKPNETVLKALRECVCAYLEWTVHILSALQEIDKQKVQQAANNRANGDVTKAYRYILELALRNGDSENVTFNLLKAQHDGKPEEPDALLDQISKLWQDLTGKREDVVLCFDEAHAFLQRAPYVSIKPEDGYKNVHHTFLQLVSKLSVKSFVLLSGTNVRIATYYSKTMSPIQKQVQNISMTTMFGVAELRNCLTRYFGDAEIDGVADLLKYFRGRPGFIGRAIHRVAIRIQRQQPLNLREILEEALTDNRTRIKEAIRCFWRNENGIKESTISPQELIAKFAYHYWLGNASIMMDYPVNSSTTADGLCGGIFCIDPGFSAAVPETDYYFDSEPLVTESIAMLARKERPKVIEYATKHASANPSTKGNLAEQLFVVQLVLRYLEKTVELHTPFVPLADVLGGFLVGQQRDCFQ